MQNAPFLLDRKRSVLTLSAFLKRVEIDTRSECSLETKWRASPGIYFSCKSTRGCWRLEINTQVKKARQQELQKVFPSFIFERRYCQRPKRRSRADATHTHSLSLCRRVLYLYYQNNKNVLRQYKHKQSPLWQAVFNHFKTSIRKRLLWKSYPKHR